MNFQLDLSRFHWLNVPRHYSVEEDRVVVVTDPATDFWQRTYYGFQHENAHAFLFPVRDDEFSFAVKTEFSPQKMFDQCGICLVQNPDNWFKASIEYDNPRFSRLGSVVTNLGYSDWASTDIDPQQTTRFYRLSRRSQDFLVETSLDGQEFQQMRMFHMHQKLEAAHIGIYACSPLNSSTQAIFSQFSLGECRWEPFAGPGI